MAGDIIVVAERVFPYPQAELFRAWTEPDELSQWRGSPGWHVDPDDVQADLRLGGRHHHVKVVDDDPSNRVVTDGVYTEFFSPDVFVSRERVTGDPGIDPDTPLELRVELVKTGRDGTLVRIIQGPYDQRVADEHALGWEREMTRLAAYLSDRYGAPEVVNP